MKKPHHLIDSSIKRLFQRYPRSFLSLAGLLLPGYTVRLEDTTVNVPELSSDQFCVLTRPDGTDEGAVYLEFQLIPDARELEQWTTKWASLNDQKPYPVVLLAVYLTRGRYRTFPERYVRKVGNLTNVFHFETLRLWEHKDRILSGEFAELAPLLLLCEDHPTEDTLRKEIELIQETGWTVEEQVDLFALAYRIGLRNFSRDILDAIYDKELKMVEVRTIFDDWRDEAIAEASTAEARRFLQRQGRKRFGEPSEQVEAHLRSIASAEELEALGERLLEVETWQELLALPTH